MSTFEFRVYAVCAFVVVVGIALAATFGIGGHRG